MKSLLFAFALTLTTAAHAITVGDSATYTGSINRAPVTMTKTVIQINGDEYITSGTFSAGGFTGTLNNASNSINDLNATNAVYAQCAAYGGTLEPVTTAIKVFSACHLSIRGDEFYLNPDVPFGIVQSITTSDGAEIELLLHSFVQR